MVLKVIGIHENPFRVIQQAGSFLIKLMQNIDLQNLAVLNATGSLNLKETGTFWVKI